MDKQNKGPYPTPSPHIKLPASVLTNWSKNAGSNIHIRRISIATSRNARFSTTPKKTDAFVAKTKRARITVTDSSSPCSRG
ncbi:hypothetical protein JTE90_022503 [Oedothorax gibbosus]|uniref:Uncharacterized protein n=1 Tax=Oedothorax gibbosus TaxID=931172 RepID=A0AAV6UZI4_9ARAC|nr:hypothetical protein JTE90_022503 [Oedothorax gibbosus]